MPNICFASDRRSYREAGVTGYIAKPVSVHVLENALTVIEKPADRNALSAGFSCFFGREVKFGFRTGQEPANILVVPQDHQQTSGAEESAIFTALETYSSTSSYSRLPKPSWAAASTVCTPWRDSMRSIKWSRPGSLEA